MIAVLMAGAGTYLAVVASAWVWAGSVQAGASGRQLQRGLHAALLMPLVAMGIAAVAFAAERLFELVGPGFWLDLQRGWWAGLSGGFETGIPPWIATHAIVAGAGSASGIAGGASWIPSLDPAGGLSRQWLDGTVGVWLLGAAIGIAGVWRTVAADGSWLRENAKRVRQIGSVGIWVAPDAACGGSACAVVAGWARKAVVVPESYVAKPELLAIALAHEIEHLRQRHLGWVLLKALMDALFWPVAWVAGRALSRTLDQIHEISCDETLVRGPGRGGRFAHGKYGTALLAAAETALASRSSVRAPQGLRWAHARFGGNGGESKQSLERRIKMIISSQSGNQGSRHSTSFRLVTGAAAVFAAVAATGLGAYAASRTLESAGDRGAWVAEFAEALQRDSGSNTGEVPLELNDLVVRRLEKMLLTENGRRYVRESRERMVFYREMIDARLAEAKLPPELIGMAFFESGFRNDVVSPVMRAKGIWQFIRPTALRMGLRIDDEIDERLDPAKETGAAVRLLTGLFGEFQDWRLAIRGYNEGAKRVRTLMEKYDTRDPWLLERKEPGENYLSGVIATLLILKYPEIADRAQK